MTTTRRAGCPGNGLNQRTAAGSTTFGYHGNGNLTSTTTSAGTTAYVYDVENRLVGRSGGGESASLRYDPLGRLYEATGPSGTRRFIWDGDALAAEYTTAGTLAATFVHGSGSGDDPLLWRGGGENRRLHADHQGSIIAITNDGGTAQWINGYDSWGIPNAGNGGRFQYTGQIWLADLGFYHYKNRIYSPSLGRFLQVDPVGYDGGINLYAYVGNDPLNMIDPSGAARACTTVTGSLVGACVTVDADIDNDGADDLSRSQLRHVGRDFHGFIQENRGADISSMGKPITGDAILSDRAMTSVVSQFIGASVSGEAARQWSNIEFINAGRRRYFGQAAAGYRARLRDGHPTSRGAIFLGGRVGYLFGGYLYDSPSNLARGLLHEMGHTPIGDESGYAAHHAIDRRARELLRSYGLDGGGCWSTGAFGLVGGFPEC